MGIRSRLGVTAASLALVSMVMAACGSSSHKAATSATGAAPTTAASSKDSAAWSAIEAAAKKEGKVTWYAVAIDPANIPQMQAAFKAKYPEISIDIIRGLPADTRAKAEAEATSGKGIADVVSDSSPAWLTKGENKVIKTGLDLPNFKATGYKADQWLHDNAYYLWTASGIGFAWNTKLDPNGAKTPDDFLNPALKGKVGVLDPTTNSYFVDYYKHMEDVWGADWVAKVASQNPKIYASAVPIAQAVASGEIAATNYASPTVVEGLKKNGAPVDWTLPKGAWLPAEYSAVMQTAPHPNAAMVLANFLLSPEMQIARGPLFISVLPNINPSLGYVADFKITNPDETTKDAPAYQAKWKSLYQH